DRRSPRLRVPMLRRAALRALAPPQEPRRLSIPLPTTFRARVGDLQAQRQPAPLPLLTGAPWQRLRCPSDPALRSLRVPAHRTPRSLAHLQAARCQRRSARAVASPRLAAPRRSAESMALAVLRLQPVAATAALPTREVYPMTASRPSP